MKIPAIFQLFKAKARDAGWMAVGPVMHGVCLAQVVMKGTRPRIVRCEYHETEEVTVETMARLQRDADLGRCTTLLSPGEYQMLLVDAPAVADNELKTAIRWKIKDSLSYPVDTATVDVLKIPVNKSRVDQRPQSLYAIAASDAIVQKRMELFEAAGVELEVIDIPETAQRNIAALFEQQDRALALLVFNEQGGLLTFTADGELYLARRIEITFGQLSDANEALRAQYRDRVELELQRSLDYFDRQFNHLSLSRVLLCVPDDDELMRLLGGAVGIPVERLDLSQVMEVNPALADSEYLSQVLHTLGAALRQEVL